MSLGACYCCEEPPCAEPVLECRSVGYEYCGVHSEDYPTDQVIYTVESYTYYDGHTSVRTYARNATTGACESSMVCAGSVVTVVEQDFYRCYSGDGFPYPAFEYHYIETYTITLTYNADCTSTTTCTGGGSWTTTCLDCDPPAPEYEAEHSGSWSMNTDCTGEGSVGGEYTGYMYFCAGKPDDVNTTTVTPEPLEEETVVYTVPATAVFPEYGLWSGETGTAPPALKTGESRGTACGASRSFDGESKCEWRVKHEPSGTCYLKAWIKKTFTPAVGAPTVTDVTPYEWTGAGNPCLADPELAVDHADNLIKGTATEEAAPATNGVTTFQLTKYSCVSGYEPDISDPENPQPNGFPDPTWEASPP